MLLSSGFCLLECSMLVLCAFDDAMMVEILKNMKLFESPQ
jgi:hypothetical protein